MKTFTSSALASALLTISLVAAPAHAADQPATSPSVKSATKPPPFASPGPFSDAQDSKAAPKKSAGKTDATAKMPPPNSGTGPTNPPPPQAAWPKFGWNIKTNTKV